MITVDRTLVDGAATVSLVAVGAGVAALVALHALPTGLSPARNAVSQYGITPYRWGYRLQTLAYAVAGVASGIALAATTGIPAIVVALCFVFAAARAAISWFPMDEPGAAHTATGRRHGLLAIAAFLAVTLAALRLSGRATGTVLSQPVITASEILGAFASLIGMAMVRRSAATNGFGAVERIFYLLMTGWFITIAAGMLS